MIIPFNESHITIDRFASIKTLDKITYICVWLNSLYTEFDFHCFNVKKEWFTHTLLPKPVESHSNNNHYPFHKDAPTL